MKFLLVLVFNMALWGCSCNIVPAGGVYRYMSGEFLGWEAVKPTTFVLSVSSEVNEFNYCSWWIVKPAGHFYNH